MPLYDELPPLLKAAPRSGPSMSEPPSPRDRRRDFAAFYRATLSPLRRFLARMLGNRADAQDVAHDAYARVYTALDREPVERPKAFLFTTARRLALNQIKRRNTAPVRESAGQIVEFAASESASVERLVMARQELARLEEAITHLPEGCRTVLLLSKVEHLSHAAIGAKLGIAVSTVEKQHARALRLLRVALAEHAAPDDTSRDSRAAKKETP